jgi:predicted SAM-dependent methyltransferase
MSSLFRKIYESSPQKIYRHFAGKKRYARAKNFMENYVASTSVRKLHVGCGSNVLPSWLNTDLVPDNAGIAMLNAGEPFPIADNTFDYIYSEHLIEHLNFVQQLSFLKESYRILKTGGKIRIATPDFDFLTRLPEKRHEDFEKVYLDWSVNTYLKNIPSQIVDADNRHVYVINNYFRDWGHQLIHNKSTISKLLSYAGFRNVQFESVGASTDAVLTGIENHGKVISDTYNRYETMVVEAIK